MYTLLVKFFVFEMWGRIPEYQGIRIPEIDNGRERTKGRNDESFDYTPYYTQYDRAMQGKRDRNQK